MKISKTDKLHNEKKVRRNEFKDISPFLKRTIERNKKKYTRKNKHKKGDSGSPFYIYCVLSFIFQIFGIRNYHLEQ